LKRREAGCTTEDLFDDTVEFLLCNIEFDGLLIGVYSDFKFSGD